MGDSPAKKLSYAPTGKENLPLDLPVVDDIDMKKPAIQALKQDKQDDKPLVAPTIKPEESHEPLLQENPHRFVLFPIKYHEVRVPNARRA